MISRLYRLLAWMSSIGMFLVLLAGALVTNTGSGRGCGDDWPLCNGKFIPAFTLETAIEYSHRVVTGLVGIIVVATFVMTVVVYRRFREPLWFAGLTLFFTIVQALMGAAAVVWYQSPPVMALHFGISLLAVASTVLLVLWVRRMDKGHDPASASMLPRSVFTWVLSAAIYCYVVVYLGAFIRHTDSGGGCLGWPLCNGEVVPELSGATGIAFAHRIAAAILFLAIAYIAFRANRTYADIPVIRTSARWALTLAGLQVISGALIVYALGTDWYLFAALLHVILIACLFGILCDLCVRVRRMAAG